MSQVNLSEFPVSKGLAEIIQDKARPAIHAVLGFADEIEIRLRALDNSMLYPKSRNEELEDMLVKLYGKEETP